MAKAGDAYRELVGVLMTALEPKSVVKTEQWITGPDGERDLDVEVRGTLRGAPHFILAECKDHARPIGIGLVDAFESKIRDLKPDRAIMFSNSGFTRDALKKAGRVGIETASAMKVNDGTIKIGLFQELVAQRLTLEIEKAFLFPFNGCPHEIEEKWELKDLLFDGLPMTHWVSKQMKLGAVEHGNAHRVWFLCTFRNEPRWSYRGQPLKVGGLKFSFMCKRDWVAQTVQSQLSLGYYDHLKRRFVVPDQQWYTPGTIDQEAWEETDKQSQDDEMEPNMFRLRFVITRCNFPMSLDAIPAVDDLILEQRFDIEP